MRRGLFVVVFLSAAAAAFTLQVDKQELSKGLGSNIQFVNYVGPHTKIDTIKEIVGIGRYLGAKITAAEAGDFTYYGSYRVIHAVSKTEPGKLDADVFIIEKSAEVDDIVNVMRILSGYLEAAYSYSPSDAGVLAKFIVYYNAAYRGDMKYITSVYKSEVTRHISVANVGIARIYSEWPGNTRMLIPLTAEAAKGELSSVGSDQLTSPKVIQNLRKEPNKGVPQRKAITDLKQREIVQGQKQVQKKKAEIAQQEQRIKKEQQAIANQKATIQKEKQKAVTPGQKQAVASKEAAVQKKQAVVEQQKQQVAQQTQRVAKQEQQLAKRQATVQKERQSIASDQRTLMKKEPPTQSLKPSRKQPPTTASTAARPGEVLFIYDEEQGGVHFGRLVAIDRVSGKLKATSELNTIRGKSYERVPNTYVVVAGRTGGGATVRLVALDATTLKVRAESKVSVAPSSSMAVDGSDIYAIEEKSNTAHLARFDDSLKELASSKAAVDPHSYIAISGNEVYVQDAHGNILILDKTSLTEKRRSGG